MYIIPQTEAKLGFSSDAYFDRTNKIRERIVDCSREELIDLSFHYLGIIEKMHGVFENQVSELYEILGYNELMKSR